MKIKDCKKIKKSQEELQQVLDAIDSCIFVIDDKYIIKKCNKSFADKFGLSPKELVFRNIKDLLSSKWQNLMSFVNEFNITKRDIYEINDVYEINLDERIYEAKIYPLKNKNLCIYVLNDVTALVAIKEKIYNSYKLASIGRIASSIAHEINNPLTGVLGYAEMINLSSDDENIKDLASKIKQATEACKKVTESLLLFARQIPFTKTMTNINDIIEAVLVLRNYYIKKNNINVEKHLGAIPYTMVDIQRLQFAIMSIIVNSEDAIIEKNVDGKIIIETYSDDKNIYIVLADNGIGIKKEYLNKIFDPFFTTKDIHKNFGLGISLTYSIIKEHDGDIEVESSFGEGTKFTLKIPINNSF